MTGSDVIREISEYINTARMQSRQVNLTDTANDIFDLLMKLERNEESADAEDSSPSANSAS